MYSFYTGFLYRLSVLSEWTLHFITSFWVIDDPFSQLCCGDRHTFFLTHFFRAVAFFLYNCFTRSLKHFSFVSKWTLPLLFCWVIDAPFSELTWELVWTNMCGRWHTFYSKYKWSDIAFFCVNVTQASCKISPLPLRGSSGELLCSPLYNCCTGFYSFVFKQSMTHSYFYAALTDTHIFHYSLIGHLTWPLLGHFWTHFLSYIKCIFLLTYVPYVTT